MSVISEFQSLLGPSVRWAALVGTLGLAACQTSGQDGLLGSVLPGNNAKDSSNNQVASANPGTNPNAGTRLKNTRNALSDYCPAVRIRSGTETFRTFPKGADKENLDNINKQATITTVARECQYVGQELRIKVGAKGRVITGPNGKSGNLVMPIRVAVTVGGDVAYSKLHRPTSTIPSGGTSTTFQFVDDQVSIPAPTATNVRVYLGFDEGPYNTP